MHEKARQRKKQSKASRKFYDRNSIGRSKSRKAAPHSERQDGYSGRHDSRRATEQEDRYESNFYDKHAYHQRDPQPQYYPRDQYLDRYQRQYRYGPSDHQARYPNDYYHRDQGRYSEQSYHHEQE